MAKKYKGWILKTENGILSDFTKQGLLNQLPPVMEGAAFTMRLIPPEPVGNCNYLDIRKGSSPDRMFLRFNIMNQDGTRQKYHSDEVPEAVLYDYLDTFMDQHLLPSVNRWSEEVKKDV